MNPYLKKSLTPLEIRRRRRLTVTSGKLSLTGLTLIELLIAIGLLSVIILAIYSTGLFSHFHTVSADRRAKLQNDVSYILEHMARQISRAIGNERADGARQVINETNIGTNQAIRVYIDANNYGRRDDSDYWIAYRLTTGNQLQHCLQCSDSNCTTCTPNDWATVVGNPLSSKIADFTVNKPQDATDPLCPLCLTDNYVEIALTACWDPDEATYACGTPDNPEVVMCTKIKMPSVSTH